MKEGEKGIDGAASKPREWGDPLQFASDEADGRRLQIMQGGNGDWYVGVCQPDERFALRGVRISTSGGASFSHPGLTSAIAAAYRALWDKEQPAAAAEARTPAFDPSFNCPTHFAGGVPSCPACIAKQPRTVEPLTIAGQWLVYREQVVPASASAVQVSECRRAFYAGANSFYAIAARMIDAGASDDELSHRTDRLHAELERFAQSVAVGDA